MELTHSRLQSAAHFFSVRCDAKTTDIFPRLHVPQLSKTSPIHTPTNTPKSEISAKAIENPYSRLSFRGSSPTTSSRISISSAAAVLNQVHRLVFASHSKYFETLFEKGFKVIQTPRARLARLRLTLLQESEERSIELKEDDLSVIKLMIDYFCLFYYEDDYDKLKGFSYPLELNAAVYIVDDEYDVPDLKRLALKKFVRAAPSSAFVMRTLSRPSNSHSWAHHRPTVRCVTWYLTTGQCSPAPRSLARFQILHLQLSKR